MRVSVVLFAATLLLPQLSLRAQEKKESNGPATYKVEFNIRDTGDPAAKGSRHYTLLMDATRRAIFKVGNRVPVATGSFEPVAGSTAANPLVSTQYSYLDVGINIECSLNETNGRLAMRGNLDLSTLVQHEPAPHIANPPNPTVVQTRLEIETTIDPGKPTVIAAIDDPVTMRHLQVETTVTRM